MGIYIQPIVQGSNYHVEFDLFYDPENAKETNRVKQLAAGVINPLISRGAFFSRPYGQTARAILNKDAATVQALRKVKTILDPDNVMNPGKLCF
jgi:FAD/FMN-containing dehydrogenase